MDNKNIFVVGGSSGIGLEIVKKLTGNQNEIFVGSRTSESLADYPEVHHLRLDVTDDLPDLEGLPDMLHGLIYCPGSIVLKPFQRLASADFQRDFEINLLGAVKLIQGCLKRLKKSPTGASVILFSTVAVKVGMPFHASVACAKGAVEGLMKSLAAEFAPRIRVNAIAPSLTDTPLAESLLSTEDIRKASADRHPLKRVGAPQEIAGLAKYLLSDGGSWITGQVFHVDGGMSSIRVFK